jgi:hypothetical protein
VLEDQGAHLGVDSGFEIQFEAAVGHEGELLVIAVDFPGLVGVTDAASKIGNEQALFWVVRHLWCNLQTLESCEWHTLA